MKKFLISILFVFATLLSFPQIKVLSIEPDEADLTARINPKQDRNGFNCALLRITTVGVNGEQRRKFSFTGDMATQIVDVTFPSGEIWVYLSPGRSTLTITHDDYGRVIYDMPYELKEKTCYVMELTAAENVNRIMTNYLVIKADQPNAVIYIDDDFVGEKEVYKSFVAGEEHTWRIECDLYHTERGSAKIGYDEKTVIEKKLRPAYGFLHVTSVPESGALVFVDGKKMGETPFMSDKIASGEHKVMVMKEMYERMERTVEVTDDSITEVIMEMKADFVYVTVTTDKQADIYVDGERKGQGSWTGKISKGKHLFEAKRYSHHTTMRTVELMTENEVNVTIPDPVPVYGILNVESEPMGAKIYLDGELKGETPAVVSNVLIGSCDLRLVKDGFVPVDKTITIKENEVLEVKEKMQKELPGKRVKVLTNKDGDKIFVDGKYKGKSPLELFLSYKEYLFKVERNGHSIMQMENIKPGSDDVIMINFEDEKYDDVADGVKKNCCVKNKKVIDRKKQQKLHLDFGCGPIVGLHVSGLDNSDILEDYAIMDLRFVFGVFSRFVINRIDESDSFGFVLQPELLYYNTKYDLAMKNYDNATLEFSSLSVPLLLGFQGEEKPLKLRAAVGPVFQLLLDQKVEVENNTEKTDFKNMIGLKIDLGADWGRITVDLGINIGLTDFEGDAGFIEGLGYHTRGEFVEIEDMNQYMLMITLGYKFF